MTVINNSNNKKEKKNNILQGTIWNALIFFALPIMFSSILQQLFNAADQVVVGRFSGGIALAAVGANTTLVSLFVNVFSSSSIGANALIAMRIGEGRIDTINRIVHTAITFALIAGIILSGLAQFLAGRLLTLMGTPSEVLPGAIMYLRIYAISFPFALVFNFGAAILRSTGDTKRPMIALVIAGVINLILNMILVIVFSLGVAGVAIATAISNVVSCTAVLVFLYKEEGELHLSAKRLQIHKESLVQILKIGGPAALQSAVFNIANTCIQSGVNSLGADAVAGSAVGGNFETMGYFVVNSFCQAATTFCGQNFGAAHMERCKKIVKIALLETMVATAIYDMCVVLLRYPVISMFTDEPGVIEQAAKRILVVMTVHFLISLYEICGACLRSMGKSLIPALLTIIGCVGFRLCWLMFLFPHFHTMEGLMLVYPASWVLTSSLTWAYYFKVRRELFGS